MKRSKMIFIIIGIIYTITSVAVSPQLFTLGGAAMVFGPFLSVGNNQDKSNSNQSLLIGGLILFTLFLLLVCNILMWIFILTGKNTLAIISILVPIVYGLGLYIWLNYFA